jgi:N-acetylmuramoyl-L-alanine amidase
MVQHSGNGRRLFLLLVLPVFFALTRPASGARSLEYEYRQASSSFNRLFKNSQMQKDRHAWLSCIDKFKSVYRAQPGGRWADDALFMIGRVYSELYRVSALARDKREALDYYARLLKRFPKTQYRVQAKEAIADLRIRQDAGGSQQKSPGARLRAKKDVSEAKALPEDNKPLPQDKEPALVENHRDHVERQLAEVTNLRFWSNPSYTRVVIDVDKEVPYSHRLLKKDPAIGKPQRLYVDVNQARMGNNLKPIVPSGDDLLSDARAARHTLDTVRVVLDIKSLDEFNIFSLKNPFRIVLDINGISRKRASKIPFNEEIAKPGGPVPKGSLAKQLALGVRRVVIDPGHGGKDPGGIGYDKRILEKNVTLEVSRRLARLIRERLGCEVVLTRDRDVFLSLEERTAIANTKNADIFISIHANASRNRNARGVETYFLNLATDDEAILVAARENATSTKNISDLEAILNDLMKNAKVNESSRLAAHVQGALVRTLKPKYKGIKDHGVKQAPFYVLLGAEMPCILVEIAFISHPKECQRLNTACYQEDVVDGIVTGVQKYIEEISPAVLTRQFREIEAPCRKLPGNPEGTFCLTAGLRSGHQ